jgi:drug/metabolite transporter (DMT)-like permease
MLRRMDTPIFVLAAFGLAAAAGWGIADFIGAKASKTLGPIMSAFVVNTIGALAFSLVFILFLRDAYTMTPGAFWYAVGAGGTITLGAIAFYKGLKAGPVSLVTPLSAAYPLVTTCLATTVFQAKLTAGQIIGVIGIVLGVMLASEIIGKNRNTRRIGEGPAYALLCATFWGIGYALMAQSAKQVGWESATLIEFGAIVVAFLVCIPFARKQEVITWQATKAMATNKIILGAALIQVAAALAFNIGLSKEATSGALVSALSACYPVLTIVLAFRHFGEKFDPIPFAGAALSIVGVIIMSVS